MSATQPFKRKHNGKVYQVKARNLAWLKDQTQPSDHLPARICLCGSLVAWVKNPSGKFTLCDVQFKSSSSKYAKFTYWYKPNSKHQCAPVASEGWQRIFVKDIEGIIRVAELDLTKPQDETVTVWLLSDGQMVDVPRTAIVPTTKAGN